MAIAGGATTAYYVQERGGVLVVDKTTTSASLCMTLDEAEQAVREGRRALVMGSDAYALRLRITAQGTGPANG